MTRSTNSRSFIRCTLCSLQFAFAVVSAALYGADLAVWSSTNTSADSRWIYAEVVAALAAISSLAQLRLRHIRAIKAVWCGIVFLLWLVAVAVLGQVALRREAVDGGYSPTRLKAAVATDISNMALWLASVVELCLCCHLRRNIEAQNKLDANGQGIGVESEEGRAPANHPPAYEEGCDMEALGSTKDSFLDEKKGLNGRRGETGASSAPNSS